MNSLVRRICGTLLVAAGASGTVPLWASESPSEWSKQISTYGWASGIGGTIRPFAGAPSIDFSKSFFDVLKDLDAALFLSSYARHERLVLLGDFNLVSSSRSGLAMIPGIGAAPAAGKLRQTSLTLAGGYRLVDEAHAKFDLLGGLRAWFIRGSVDVAGGALSRSPEFKFVDPLLAARLHWTPESRWSAIFYVDVGGFGAGSRLTTHWLATANYRLQDQLYLSAGFRQMNIDYRDSGSRLDVQMSGPLIGATWRF